MKNHLFTAQYLLLQVHLTHTGMSKRQNMSSIIFTMQKPHHSSFLKPNTTGAFTNHNQYDIWLTGCISQMIQDKHNSMSTNRILNSVTADNLQ